MGEKLNENKMVTILDSLYDKSLKGIPNVSKPVEELANDYIKRYPSSDKAAKSLISYQIAKCGTSGFITGLGGLITLPVSLPANITSVLYIQLRMVTAIAKIGGFDIHSDQVQTMAYACLTGSAVADIVKQTGIKVGEKVTENLIKQIPGKALAAINKKVGFRLLTKFGEKGIINFVKLVPIAGGIIGGSVDIVSTKVIANSAYKIFIKKEMPSSSEKEEEIVVDADDYEEY